jgi:hypothetical protein
VRRYGGGELVHLERKKRQGDRVRKRREVLPLPELARLSDPDGAGTWFGRRIGERGLRPVCWVTYARTAFVGAATTGPVRLTLDRDIAGAAASDWTVPVREDGLELLPGKTILELKFRSALPGLFHELLGTLPGLARGGSKYGRCVEAWHLAREGQ